MKTSHQLVDALERAHKALSSNLHALEEAIATPPLLQPADLGKRLRELRHTLLEHFRFEEQNGYMDAVLHGRPNLMRAVERLQEDHARLAQELDGLIDESNRLAQVDATFAGKIRAWVKWVHDHESRENTLVEEAFNRDTVAED